MRKQGQQNILKKHQRSPKKTQKSKQQFKNQLPHSSTINKISSKPNQPIQYIYSKVNKNIQQSIDRLSAYIDKKRKQLNESGNEQSADSKLHQQYKKLNSLTKEIQQNSQKLVKTLFQYYYEVMVNVEVLLNQQLFPQKQMRSMFPKIYETLDSLKTPCSITYDSVLLPPVICQNDLRLVYDSLTNKASLILDKQNDLYQTSKPKELVNFYIKLIDLAEFIKKISQELFECFKLDKQLKVTSSRLNNFFKQKSYFSSETRQILLILVQFVNQKMYEQHNQTLSSTESMDIKKLFLSCFKHSMEFIQKVFFYNFIAGCHSCFTKKSIFYHICLESSQLEPIGIQYTDMKLRLLKLTMKKPDILRRIFKQSLSFKLVQIFVDNWNTKQFNYQNFYLYSSPIVEEQKMIQLLIKYQIHYALFVLDMISEVSSKDNITFKNIYNCYRHMLMILTANATFRTIKVVEREIKYCHGNWVYQRVLQKRNTNVRWIDCVYKLFKTIQYSSERFKSYLPDKNQNSLSKQQKSDNYKQMKKLQMQNAPLISMIKQLSRGYEDKIVQASQMQQQLHHKIYQIYSQIFNILSKVLFNQNQFTIICRRLCKRFGIKFTKFQQFMSTPFQLKQPGNFNQQKSKKELEPFQKQFKIVQIEMLKIYNIFTTLPFYSFVTELQRGRPDEPKNNKSKVKSYQQLFKNLQVMYIHNRQVLNTTYLTNNSRTMNQINEILQYQTGLTQVLNGFFQTCNQQKDGQISHIDDPKTVKIYKYSPVLIKNFIPILKGKNFVEERLKQQKQTIEELMSQSTFDTTKTTAYKKKLNRGQNYNFDLNLVINRQIHKNTVTNISRYQSWRIKKLIVQKFLTDKHATNFKSIINNNSIRRTFRFSYKQNQKISKRENQSESQIPIDNQKQNESTYSMKKMKIKFTQGRISPTKGQIHESQQKQTFQPEDEAQNSIITDKTSIHKKSNHSNSSKYESETGI